MKTAVSAKLRKPAAGSIVKPSSRFYRHNPSPRAPPPIMGPRERSACSSKGVWAPVSLCSPTGFRVNICSVPSGVNQGDADEPTSGPAGSTSDAIAADGPSINVPLPHPKKSAQKCGVFLARDEKHRS